MNSPAGTCCEASRGATSDRTRHTGPSISTRTSLTSVPICTAAAPSGEAAAITCGNRVDGEPGERAKGVLAHPERESQQRQAEHHHDAPAPP